MCVCVCVSAEMSPYCSTHDEWLTMKLCMYVVCIMWDGAIHYKLYLLKLTMAVDNIVFRITKGAF